MEQRSRSYIDSKRLHRKTIVNVVEQILRLSAELHNVVANVLQMVRILEIADGNGPSLLGPEEPFFPAWAGILAGNSTSLFNIRR
jgi:hypothetical protein